MAPGGKIGLWCLTPTKDNWDWHNDLDLEELAYNSGIGDYQEINFLSPLTTLAGENAAYYYDQMQVEKHATPAGLGMVDRETVVIWNLPNPKQGTKLWKFKKKLKLICTKLNNCSFIEGSLFERSLELKRNILQKYKHYNYRLW